MIYAANDNIPQDENTFQKHTVRGSKSLLLFSDRPDTQDGVPPEPGATPMEFRMVNVSTVWLLQTILYGASVVHCTECYSTAYCRYSMLQHAA